MIQNIKESLKKVTIISEEELTKAQYIKTAMVKAKREDGRDIAWEMEKGYNSVHIMVDNIDEECIELVQQVRVPVKVTNPETDGVTTEACAGLIDKNKDTVVIAQEELLEEMGYDVPTDYIVPVRVYNSNVGKSGNQVHTFKTEVTNSMRVSEGGGLLEEDICIVKLPYENVMKFIEGKDEYKNIFTDATTLFLLQDWIISNTY